MSEETKQKNPHLFCRITGKSRPTTWAYLKDKADRLETDVDNLINNYVSREAITQLLDGASVEDIRSRYKEAPDNVIDNDELHMLIRLNSKAKKAAEKFNSNKMNVIEVAEETPVTEEVITDEPVVQEEKPKKKRSRKKKTEEAVIEEPIMQEEPVMHEEPIMQEESVTE